MELVSLAAYMIKIAQSLIDPLWTKRKKKVGGEVTEILWLFIIIISHNQVHPN